MSSQAIGAVFCVAVLAGCGPIDDRRELDEVECTFEPTGRTAAPHLGRPLAFSASVLHWVNNQVTDARPIRLDGATLRVVDGAGQAVPGTSQVVDHYLLQFRPAEPLTQGGNYSASTSRVTEDGCAWGFTPIWPESADPSWALATLDGVRAADLVLPPGGGALVLSSRGSSQNVLHRADDSGALDGAVAATTVGPVFDTPYRWTEPGGSVAVTADGSVLLAGRWTGDGNGWWAQRLDPAGVPDDAFGAGGVVVVEEPSWGPAPTYEVQILAGAGGTAIVALKGTADDAVVRLLADGSLDAGFGVGGRLDILPEDVLGARVLPLAAGGILVVSSSGPCAPRISRYAASGALDVTFGDAGRRCLELVPAGAAAIDAEGRILLAGSGPDDTTAVARLLPDGQPDTTFGDGGRVSLPGRYLYHRLAAGGARIALYRSVSTFYTASPSITRLDDAGAVLREEPLGDDLPVAGLALDASGRAFVLATFTGSSRWEGQLVLERLQR